MPPVFTYAATVSLKSSDNVELVKALTAQPGNAKLLLDNTLPVGPSTLDLGPLLAPILDPQWIVIVLGGDGAQLKFDGGVATAKAFKTVALQATPNTPGPSGVLDIEVDSPSPNAAQRIQVFCIGL